MYDPAAVVYHEVNRQRESLKYVWTRSFYEGLSKAVISFKSDSTNVLSTETSYLRFLLSEAIPLRLKHIFKPEKVGELLTLTFSMFAVLAGFLTGRIMKRTHNGISS